MKPIGLASGYKQTEHLIFKTDSFFKKNLLDLRHPLDRNHTHVADISVTKPYHSNEFQWASKVAHSPRKIVKGLIGESIWEMLLGVNSCRTNNSLGSVLIQRIREEGSKHLAIIQMVKEDQNWNSWEYGRNLFGIISVL